jgi:hypothetical protein
MGRNSMKKLILFLIIAVLASCSAPQKGYNYKHHNGRQQKMYKQTKRVNKGKNQLQHQCSPKKHR